MKLRFLAATVAALVAGGSAAADAAEQGHLSYALG